MVYQEPMSVRTTKISSLGRRDKTKIIGPQELVRNSNITLCSDVGVLCLVCGAVRMKLRKISKMNNYYP